MYTTKIVFGSLLRILYHTGWNHVDCQPSTDRPATEELKCSRNRARRRQRPSNNTFKVWQNLPPFGGRPIGSAVEVLLTKVVNWQYWYSPIVVFFVAAAVSRWEPAALSVSVSYSQREYYLFCRVIRCRVPSSYAAFQKSKHSFHWEKVIQHIFLIIDCMELNPSTNSTNILSIVYLPYTSSSSTTCSKHLRDQWRNHYLSFPCLSWAQGALVIAIYPNRRPAEHCSGHIWRGVVNKTITIHLSFLHVRETWAAAIVDRDMVLSGNWNIICWAWWF